MKAQEGDHPPDELARRLVVENRIERVRRAGMVHRRDRPIDRERGGDERVDGVVQPRELVVAGARDKERRLGGRSATDRPAAGVTNRHCFAASATIVEPSRSSIRP